MLGGTAATFHKPGQSFQSGVQHFAAGVVFAAVAVELLPQELSQHRQLPLILGFAAGVGFMLGAEWVIGRLKSKGSGASAGAPTGVIRGGTAGGTASPSSNRGGGSESEQPTGLLVAVGVDLAIDGLLIGVGFAAGTKQGILITIALTLEVLFVGLSVAGEYADAGAKRSKMIGVTAGLAAIIAVGGVAGVTLLGGLSGAALTAVLAFGSAALLYLVTEELLVEAHESPDTPLIVAAFFLGFLLILVIDGLTI